MIILMQIARRLSALIVTIFLIGCGANYSPTATGYSLDDYSLHSSVTSASAAPCSSGCLYVTNTFDDSTCLCTRYEWLEYGPPFNSSSRPLFGKALNFANGIAADSLYLATTGSDVNRVKIYHLPDTSMSNIYFASIALAGQPQYVAFDKSHDVWVADGNNEIEEFVPPFASTNHHARVVTNSIAGPISLAFDNSNNLYVGQTPNGFASGPVQLLRFAPPYSGSPQIFDPGIFPLGLSIHDSTLAVTGEAAVGIAHCNCAGVNVFTLPLSSASTPVSMDFNQYGIPGGPAFDAAGNLFVPLSEALHSAPPGVIVYRPPFNSSNHGAFEIHQGMQAPGSAAIGP